MKAAKSDFEKASETDEVEVQIKFYQGKTDLFEPWSGPTHDFEYSGLVSDIKSQLLIKLLESMRKGEKAEFTINAGFLNGSQEEDESLEDGPNLL